MSNGSLLVQTTPGLERRQNMPLDTAYFYFRHIELKLQTPDLFKICNSLKTIDVVLSERVNSDGTLVRFSADAWSKTRDGLFQSLLENFSGKFLVYSHKSSQPLKSEDEWATADYLVFYPEKLSRPGECYKQSIYRLDARFAEKLQRLFVEQKSPVVPEDFQFDKAQPNREAVSLLQRFYSICEEEAEVGRATAHHELRDLEHKVKKCADRSQRKHFHKRISRLQTIWGNPAHRS